RFKTFPNTNLPLYLHVMFQGMFAIITVALISGAFAERVKFLSYCIFALLWTTLVYDPIAHWVWSFDWTYLDSQKVDVPLADLQKKIAPAAGMLGKNGAIDFAGGTVVHIAAGASGLAAVLLLRKRVGYGKQTFHPNSMILTLLGAGLLWFGWFGFNGGSALFANGQAVSAFTVTQIAAATAGLGWTVIEWLHRGKPTALGFASGLVAGLVAITPASGFVSPVGALIIGMVAGIACYWAVAAKSLLGYDDSLD
ncbi:MAG: ammonium transporter, partial [Armatimonadaceae bacterium]